MFSDQFRASRSAHDPHWLQKFILRLVIVIIAIIGLIIGTVAWTTAYSNDVIGIGLGGVWIFYLVAWIVSILWAVANWIRLGVSESPIPPGAIVGVDLIAWLLYLLASIFGFSWFALDLIRRQQCANDPDYGSYYYDYDYEYDYCSNSGDGLNLAAIVIMAFGGLANLIIHFYLFVRGCIETHRRRHARYAAVQPVPMNGNYAYVPPQATQVPPDANYNQVPAGYYVPNGYVPAGYGQVADKPVQPRANEMSA